MNPIEPTPNYEYYVGGSLEVNAPTYVTRQADQDLYEGLRAGDFCYVLNSRQMGKSSLRVRTMQRLQSEGFACASIYVTSTGSQNITPDKWYAGIIQSLVNNFGLGDRLNLRYWLRDRDMLSPVQRFSEFIETIILRDIAGQIVIFVDEIDSVLSLDFGIDDFFAVIRECYDRRGSQPDYKRLTFALLGVAAPTDLIQDKRRTPFNIGRAIDLTGFSLEEAQPLALGLVHLAADPSAVLDVVVGWTGGQPFLTQKVCKLLLQLPSMIGIGEEAGVVAGVIRGQVVENWEAQDVPEHLKTIRDRLLRGNKNEQLTGRLLGLCQQILEADLVQYPSPNSPSKGMSSGIPADESYEQMQLRLTGLAVQRDGRLIIYNAIYVEIFNFGWVERALTSLRPPFYAVAMAAWQEAGEEQKGEFLLRGQALQEAEAWAKNKRLSNADEEFLAVSREFEKQETEQKLRATEEANVLLLAAERKARQRVQFGSVFLVLALVLAAFAGTSATISVNEAKKATERLKETEAKGQELSDKAYQAEQQVKSAQKKVEETDQQAKQNEKLAAEKQREAEQIRQQAEEASQNEKLAAEKQREAEQKVGEANQNLLAARTNLENLQGQSAESQIRLAQATAQVNAAEAQVNVAKQQRQQALQALMAAEENTRIVEQRVNEVEQNVLVGRINLSVFEARSSFSNGQKLDALLKALRARTQLELLGKEAWSNDDSKTKVTLALQQAVYSVREKDRLQHTDIVLSVAFSPDGKTIAAGGFDQNVTLWSAEGERLKIFDRALSLCGFR